MTFKVSIAKGVLLAGLAALSLGASAHAATYLYTGKDFNSFTSPTTYSTADSVTGSITLTAPLPDNVTSFSFLPSASIVSFSFSDGEQTITNATATGSAFAFKTNASGDITAWQVTVDIGSVSADSIATVDAPGILGAFDQGVMTLNDTGGNRNLPGSWSLMSSAAPEPASWAVMLTGFGAIGASLRRRRYSAVAASN